MSDRRWMPILFTALLIANGGVRSEPAAAAGGFDPSSVPVTSASLPPFPFFKTPDGLVSVYDDKDKNISYDGQYFIAGDKAVLVEGRIFRDAFNLQNDDRAYSELEFHKNYENVVTALGGRKINTAQYTPEVVDAVGGRDAVEKHHYGAVAIPDYRHDSYLIRTADKEYWIDISSGAIPLHGYVVVLEKQGMRQSVGLLDAAAMKQAIDDKGRVALYINFDVDKATLRAGRAAGDRRDPQAARGRSGAEAVDRRPHRQHRQRRTQPAVVDGARAQRARRAGRIGHRSGAAAVQGPWPGPADRRQRQRRRSREEPARGAGEAVARCSNARDRVAPSGRARARQYRG